MLKGIIIEDDRRYHHMRTFLENKGHYICTNSHVPKDLDFVIFPFAAELDQKQYGHGFFAGLKKGVLIFSGIRSGYIDGMCKQFGLEYIVMMENRGVAEKNAVPTSEGVIAYLITSMARTLEGSRILIIGYGNCGRDLAKRLKALGVCVTALVRNKEKEMTAAEDGVAALYLKDFHKLDFDVIINTVPSTVLPDEMLKDRLGTILIDISSKPHGFNIEKAKKLNEKSALLPGIPGKYAVKTAGEILGEYIHGILEGGAS